MKDLQNIVQKLRELGIKYLSGVSKHRILLIFAILSIAIASALLTAQSFIDIPRNEELYTEQVLQINYKGIDQDILQAFREAGEDDTIEVNPDFAPTRNNPFSE